MTSMSLRPLMSVKTDPAPAKTRVVVSPWVWMAVTCLLLGLSGGFRLWREWKFSALAGESAACPFPLADLPRTMATWQTTETSEAQLDPEVMRYAGASEHVIRTYVDQKTGELASALVLYGLGSLVYAHSPDVCYPASGWQLARGPIDDTISVPGVESPVRYRWAIYTKKQVGGLQRYEEVYCTFLHHGEWMPDAAARWKLFRYYPGLFKIQIAHPASSLNQDGNGPCLPLLTEIAGQISQRLTAARAGGGASAAKATTAAAQ
jgi:hypothetical protein